MTRVPQSTLSIHLQPAGNVDQAEQKVTQFPCPCLLVFDDLQFSNLLGHFFQYPLEVRPIETGSRCPVAEHLGPGQRGQDSRNSVQAGVKNTLLLRSSAFADLDGLPIAQYVSSAVYLHVAKDVGMAAFELGINPADHIGKAECPRIGSNLDMHGNLHQQIAQFFT